MPATDAQELGRRRVARIEHVLNDAFSPTSLTVEDESHRHRGHAGAKSGGGHFNVTIVSDAFEGKNRLSRHRMVYASLEQELGGEIHALSVKAMTVEESKQA